MWLGLNKRVMGVMLMLAALFGPACCPTCRQVQQPDQAECEVYETPLPYRLQYRRGSGQYVKNFVVIQGAPEFVLAPDIPEQIFRGGMP